MTRAGSGVDKRICSYRYKEWEISFFLSLQEPKISLFSWSSNKSEARDWIKVDCLVKNICHAEGGSGGGVGKS